MTIEPVSRLDEPIQMAEVGSASNSIWIWGGMASGAVVGLCGGVAGMLGGAVGGAVLGPAVNWWRGLSSNPPRATPLPSYSVVSSASDSQGGRPQTTNSLPLGGLTPNPQTLSVEPQVTQLPLNTIVSPKTPALPRKSMTKLAKTTMPSTQPNLQTATAIVPTNAKLINPPVGLIHAKAPPPTITVRIVPADDQKYKMRLDNLISLASPSPSVNIEYYSDPGGTHALPPYYKSPNNIWTVYYRIVSSSNKGSQQIEGQLKSEILDTRLSTEEIMREMKFVKRNWRWELQRESVTYGTKTYQCHLTVPVRKGRLPTGWAVNLKSALDLVFYKGQGFDGTHMSLECSQSEKMNNAAYFLNGLEKNAQGYLNSENLKFIKACKKRMTEWLAERENTLKTAIEDLLK